MKTLSILSLFVFFGASVFAQTIRRVNNTPGLNDPNVYATAQAAHDAASPNDIISIESSSGSTYNLLATKRINIVGAGYDLDKNPNTVFDKRQIALDLTLTLGSKNSTVSGVLINSLLIQANNILIERCKVGSITFGNSGLEAGIAQDGLNSVIKNCLISQISRQTLEPNKLYNISFLNNIILGSINNSPNYTFSYNTINANFGNCKGVFITNNIFDHRNYPLTYKVADLTSNPEATLSYNIALGISSLPTGNGNINNADPLLVFIGSSNPFSTYSTNGDNDFKLAVGSPALTSAIGGTQGGAFGNGAGAYRVSGVPNTPIITSFVNTGAGNNTTPLSITVSVRSNN